MSCVDPISDLITRIRNAHMIGRRSVESPASKMRLAVLEVLKREGYIRNYSKFENSAGHNFVKVELKYTDSQPVIRHISRVSKSGCRSYTGVKMMPKVQNGLGIMVVSTSKGMMSDYEARDANVGGEIVCQVY